MEHSARRLIHAGTAAAVLFLLLTFVVLPMSASSGANKPSAGPPAAPITYVGADTCKTCHEDLYKKFETTPHYRTLLDTRGGAAHQGCEACHGAGGAHVDGGGDVTKIFNFKGVEAKNISDRCLECHNRDEARTNFRRSAHHDAQVACTECHSVHKAKSEGGNFLLTKSQPQLCYGCHQEVKSEFMRPFRHRIQEGLLECNDCHNEHGGFNKKSLRSSVQQDQVCFKCHADKQGPFVYEHMPVRTDGCTSCHTPHGSSNPRMLKRSQVNQLCTDCHANWFGTPSVPTHNQAQRYQACTICHNQIHGSNTDVRFFK